MRTTVHLTVDTESTMGGAWRDAGLRPVPARRHVFCENSEGAFGLPLICDELERHGHQATFFVEMLAGHVLGEDDTRSVTDYLQKRDQDVQLHTHPTFRHFRDYLRQREAGTAPDSPRETDQLSAHTADEQREILTDAVELFERAVGRRPTVYRSGGFAADRRCLPILNELGIVIDSSFNPIYRHSNLSFRDDPPETNKVAKIDGVWEMPITVGSTNIGEGVGLKHLDPTSVSASEIESMLDQAHAGGMRHVVAIFHCFSTVKTRDYQYTEIRPNRIVIRRLRRFLDYLARNEDRFEVATLGELASELDRLEGEHPAPIPNLGFWRPATRKVVQAVNNLFWI